MRARIIRASTRGRGDEVSRAKSRRRRSIFERVLVRTEVRLLLLVLEVNDRRRPRPSVFQTAELRSRGGCLILLVS
jgi:hypothetical protein